MNEPETYSEWALHDEERQRRERLKGPAKTVMEWELHRGEDDTTALGIERPATPDQLERFAGKYVWDDGRFREIRFVAVMLPHDVEAAVGLTFREP